jgi:CBS domain-containing protein
MIFRDADCGAVPVVEDGKPVGVLTDRDVALALTDYPDLVSRPVTDIMTKGVVAVAPDATLSEVRDRFGEQAVRRLLVIDARNQLVGIVAWADVAPYLDECEVGEVVAEVTAPPPIP